MIKSGGWPNLRWRATRFAATSIWWCRSKASSRADRSDFKGDLAARMTRFACFLRLCRAIEWSGLLSAGVFPRPPAGGGRRDSSRSAGRQFPSHVWRHRKFRHSIKHCSRKRGSAPAASSHTSRLAQGAAEPERNIRFSQQCASNSWSAAHFCGLVNSQAFNFAANVVKIGCCPFVILFIASVIENQLARSTSEKLACFPDFGGHSSKKVLLTKLAESKSLSIAHATIILPPGCLKVPNSRNLPSAIIPVSSRSSLLAATSGSSDSSYKPFGIDHEPSSFFAQKGPPGWTNKS
jgi:hypothetical protein